MTAITKALRAAWREFLREFKRQQHITSIPDPLK